MCTKTPAGIPQRQQPSSSIPSINLQVELDAITNAVILKRKLILEWPLALSFQHNFVRLSANTSRDLGFE